jgi:UDP-glucose-4-epimerase GalE
MPVVLDNLSTGHREFVRWGPLTEGNIGDGPLVRRLLASEKIESVIHFAASAYIGESMQRPREYFANNVVNTLNLLDAMIESDVRSIVFSSSCAVYGVPDTIPIDENHRESPVNPYGESKLFIERALRWYGEAYGLRSVVLRYFNAAGADPNGQIGEFHEPETHLLPLAIDAALGVRSCVRIYGNDYATPDGTAVRDYVHVSDLASAHVAAVEYLRGSGPSERLNLGTGTGHSVRQIIRAVERVAGGGMPIIEEGRRPGDPPALVACAGRASAVLGWRPVHSDLETIVGTAWAWADKARRRARQQSAGEI